MKVVALRRSMRKLLTQTAATGVVAVAILVSGSAAALKSDESIQATRDRVASAFVALRTGDHERFLALRSSVNGHLLTGYLDFESLRARFSSVANSTVEQFLDAHKGEVVARRLRHYYVRRLGKQQKWAAFLKHFQGSSDPGIQCQHATALWAQGRVAQATALSIKLWTQGRSQPPSCDAPFEALRRAGQLTPPLIAKRFALAMRAGKVGLADYLARALPSAERALAQRWRKLRNTPEDAARITDLSAPLALETVRDSYHRLAREDERKAAQLWKIHGARLKWPKDVKANVMRRIGLALATSHDPLAVEWLASINDDLADDDVRAWRVTSALRHDKIDAALHALARLDRRQLNDVRWQYWSGRLEEQSGAKARSDLMYARAAAQRDYYGFLAADKLDQPYRLNNNSAQPSATDIDAVFARPPAQRAKELLAIGRLHDARREWFDLIGSNTALQLAAAAYLASQWGWHDMAILTIARARRFDDLVVRFPRPYQQVMEKEARRYAVEADWVRGVARQESAYQANARSPAGALGLMQIMPATGKNIARRLGIPLTSQSRLYDPALNVRFGASYLSRLRGKFDGHIALATAAYNAGPHRVRRWLPESGEMAADVWVETVPFRETRGYVKRVLEYSTIYALLQGRKPPRLSQRLPPIKPLVP
jgi:soluble lytic murein transglycosylase